MKFLLFITVGLCATPWVHPLKILGIYPIPSYSHYSLGRILMESLAEKGHDVTLVTPYDEKDAKFKWITLKPTEQKDMNFFQMADMPNIGQMLFLHHLGPEIIKLTFEHPNFQKLLGANETYDVIIFEQFVNEGYRAICNHFKAPCVITSSVESNYWTNIPTGNPENPAYIPLMALGHFGPMNFCKRVQNFLLNTFLQLVVHLYAIPEQDKAMRATFPDAPPLSELLYEPALYLLNSHASTAAPVALLPSMIEIGGYHVKPHKKLPEDLQKFLDDAKEGAIYFSMGSGLKSKNFPMEKRKALLEAFSKLKVKVLWKFEEDLPEKPDNVKISKWFPQQDILAHPNIKLFITHGGLLSTIEAIYHGVPVIGIPIYGDQETNMDRAQVFGFAISLSYATLTEPILTQALNDISSNNKYSENAKRLSKIMHDRPMKPLDTALYWIEYVARHKGVQHLKTARLDLYWYQALLLDVLTVLISALMLGIFVVKIALQTCCRLFSSKSGNKKKEVMGAKKNT